ncbi:hypothetical protein GCM10027040_33910 [Halomonas shantousis]
MANDPMKDKNYDMVSVLYHVAQGSENSRKYAEDARQEGDNEAAEFFEEAQRVYVELGTKGKKLLKDRL